MELCTWSTFGDFSLRSCDIGRETVRCEREKASVLKDQKRARKQKGSQTEVEVVPTFVFDAVLPSTVLFAAFKRHQNYMFTSMKN